MLAGRWSRAVSQQMALGDGAEDLRYVGGRNLDCEGEGRRRSAGSGAAQEPRSDCICDVLLTQAGYGELDARPIGEVRCDGGGSDGMKTLAIRAANLSDLGIRSRCRGRHFGHAPASMRTVGTAADGQQLLRGGERKQRCRWEQPTENA
jgi:hypothetical protein